MTITLDEVKDYLSVDRDFKNDDPMILGILEASVDAVQRHINHEFAPEDKMPPAVRQAVLMMAAGLYNSREAYTTESLQISPAVELLLNTVTKYNRF